MWMDKECLAAVHLVTGRVSFAPMGSVSQPLRLAFDETWTFHSAC